MLIMKAIVFDFDGVIHDSLTELYKLHCAYYEEIEFEKYKKLIFEGNCRVYNSKFSNEQKIKFDRAWKECCSNFKLEKKIRESLEILSKKYDLYIISSNDENNLDEFFKRNNFLNIFKRMYGYESHQLKTVKFRMLFEDYKLTKDDCIFVTDTLGDILEANEVGVKTIAVEFGCHDHKTLEKGNPYKIVSSFDEILKVIEEIR